jgi:hypothetical protein
MLRSFGSFFTALVYCVKKNLATQTFLPPVLLAMLFVVNCRTEFSFSNGIQPQKEKLSSSLLEEDFFICPGAYPTQHEFSNFTHIRKIVLQICVKFLTNL